MTRRPNRNPLTEAELSAWRGLIGAAEAYAEAPSDKRLTALIKAGAGCYRLPMPCRDDEVSVRQFYRLCLMARSGARDPALGALATTCARLLGDDAAPAPAAPLDAPAPYYLRD